MRLYSQALQHMGNEEGAALVSALLILMLLTFVALMATHTTNSEKTMVRSEAIFQKDFFLAESGAVEAVQIMHNTCTSADPDPADCLAGLVPSGTSPTVNLLKPADSTDPDNDLLNIDGSGGGATDNTVDGADFAATSAVDGTGNTYRLVSQKPISSGDSLALGASRVYDYGIYGFSEAHAGRSLIKMGYRLRF
ncbi:MAG: hypothetical protein CSA34_03175 [Desulfobulbus propionicus]|nr:MAG: hypothetical protein CSA34_03175 [Desulfobulbus propionicus]